MSGYPFAVAICIALVIFMVVLMRTRRLREKYAIIWIVVGVGVVVFAAFPSAVEALTHVVGVQTPSNLLFAIALVVLLLVCVQLSTEVTGLEEETRTLAEEIAMLRFDLERGEFDTRRETTGAHPEASTLAEHTDELASGTPRQADPGR